MTTFKCNGGGIHEISAEKTQEEGLIVNMDGESKILPPGDASNIALLSSESFFGDHEHCIRGASMEIRKMLKAAMEKPQNDPAIKNPNELRRLMDNTLQYGDTADLEALFDEGVDVDQEDWEGRSALMICSFKGNKASVEMLLNRGANVNKVHIYHGSIPMTALDAAREGRQHEIAKILIAHGAKTGRELNKAQ